MILEIAILNIRAGEETAFEEAVAKGSPLIVRTPGYISHELRRCIETKGRYVLLVRWETLEAHTVGFRESASFPAWRAIIGPFFASAPLVEHYESAGEWPAPQG